MNGEEEGCHSTFIQISSEITRQEIKQSSVRIKIKTDRGSKITKNLPSLRRSRSQIPGMKPRDLDRATSLPNQFTRYQIDHTRIYRDRLESDRYRNAQQRTHQIQPKKTMSNQNRGGGSYITFSAVISSPCARIDARRRSPNNMRGRLSLSLSLPRVCIVPRSRSL